MLDTGFNIFGCSHIMHIKGLVYPTHPSWSILPSDIFFR